MIAVACKLIRVFYLILQTGATYDAAKLMGGYPETSGGVSSRKQQSNYCLWPEPGI